MNSGQGMHRLTMDRVCSWCRGEQRKRGAEVESGLGICLVEYFCLLERS